MILDPISPGRFLLADDRVLDWIANRIPYVGPDHHWHGVGRALGVVSDGKLIAGMAILHHDRKHGNAEVAMAAETPRWATRATIAKLLAYPFGQLGCQRLTTLIAASNARSLRFNEWLGFKREGVLRRAFGEDAIVLGLLKEEIPAWAVAPTHEIA